MNMRAWSAALGGFLVACASDPVSPVALRATAVLRYRATTAIGMTLLVGRLDLTVHADSTVTGSWAIDWAPGADRSTRVGPQVGSGTFTGARCADSWCLNLNQYIDNNVFLTAKSVDSGLVGTWSWSTIAGTAAEGSFTARYDP